MGYLEGLLESPDLAQQHDRHDRDRQERHVNPQGPNRLSPRHVRGRSHRLAPSVPPRAASPTPCQPLRALPTLLHLFPVATAIHRRTDCLVDVAQTRAVSPFTANANAAADASGREEGTRPAEDGPGSSPDDTDDASATTTAAAAIIDRYARKGNFLNFIDWRRLRLVEAGGIQAR